MVAQRSRVRPELHLYHLSSAANAPLLAAGPLEGEVGVFDLRSGNLLSRYRTGLDWGGRRLAMSGDGSTVVAAAYSRYGVSAHDALTGRVVWARKDLKHAQTLRNSADGGSLFVRADRFTIVDLMSGKETDRLPAIDAIWESPDGEYRIVETMRRLLRISRYGVPVGVVRAEYNLLDCAFGPGFVVVSESGGALRMISLPAADEVWRTFLPGPSHATRLCYEPSRGVVLANAWPYVHGGAGQLLSLDPADGRLLSAWAGSHYDGVFALDGACLVLPDATLHNSSSGEFLRSLELVKEWVR
ncbi:MAG: hypothetical protein ACRDHF_06435 [Tepidiformaceae bacterium]